MLAKHRKIKFTQTEWNVRQIRYWFNRNKIGLIFGVLFGFLVFLAFWYHYDFLFLNYLLYPFSLIFGCVIPLWSLIVFMGLYGVLGACIDSLLSKQEIDKRRAIIVLVVLALIFACLFMYRTYISKDFCDAGGCVGECPVYEACSPEQITSTTIDKCGCTIVTCIGTTSNNISNNVTGINFDVRILTTN